MTFDNISYDVFVSLYGIYYAVFLQSSLTGTFVQEEDEAIYSTPSVELCELEQRVRRARSVDMNLADDSHDDVHIPRAISDMNLSTPRSGRG